MASAIIGHSFIARLEDDPVAMDILDFNTYFLGLRGATSRSLVQHGGFRRILASKVKYVFLQIGSNDIQKDSNPEVICKDIRHVVEILRGVAGMERIVIGSLFPRYCPRGMTAEEYSRQRDIINDTLQNCYSKDRVVTFWKLRGLYKIGSEAFPDGVHLHPYFHEKYARQIRLSLWCNNFN